MFREAVAVDKHNQSYRGLLKQAKLQLAKATKKDFYGMDCLWSNVADRNP